ncbi:MAG: DinB family protein [Saprospiraceae bacterium]|nr:DinB family protein [Saprospiraceae bacterium]
MKRPKKGEYAPFYQTYISALPARGTAKSLLKKSFSEFSKQLSAMPESVVNAPYAPDKWNIKQLLVHLIDAERVFSFRILWFLRGDRAPLPGFNQDHWMEQVDVGERSMASLLKEWKSVRDNTLFLLEQCSEEQSRVVGRASNWDVSVRALFYIVIGHQMHHMNVLRSYGVLS